MESDSALEAVVAAAARDELGALLDSWPTGTWRLAKGKEIVHRFERGLVVDRGAKKGPLVLPHCNVSIYRRFNPTVSRAGEPVFDWTFARTDGRAWTTLVNERGRGKGKSARQFHMYNDALRKTCARQREAALQRLSEGGALLFGSVELDLSRITFGRETASWARVDELSVYRRGQSPAFAVDVSQDDTPHKLRLSADMESIPNFPLLWELAHLAHGRSASA